MPRCKQYAYCSPVCGILLTRMWCIPCAHCPPAPAQRLRTNTTPRVKGRRQTQHLESKVKTTTLALDLMLLPISPVIVCRTLSRRTRTAFRLLTPFTRSFLIHSTCALTRPLHHRHHHHRTLSAAIRRTQNAHRLLIALLRLTFRTTIRPSSAHTITCHFPRTCTSVTLQPTLGSLLICFLLECQIVDAFCYLVTLVRIYSRGLVTRFLLCCFSSSRVSPARLRLPDGGGRLRCWLRGRACISTPLRSAVRKPPASFALFPVFAGEYPLSGRDKKYSSS